MSAATANVRAGMGTIAGLRSVRRVAVQKPSRFSGVGGFVATTLVFLAFAGMSLAFIVVPNKPETVLALGVGFMLVLCIMRWPIVGTFTCMVLAILFDSLPSPYLKTVISELGVFRNLSYRGLPQAVWVSMFEILVVLTLASALFRRFHAHQKVIRGAVFFPVMAYGAAVFFGEINGLLSGGDFKISLWEVRPLGYIVVLYVLAVNTVNKPWHTRALIWVTVLTTAARCLEGISRYYSLAPSVRGDIPTILEHDDSLILVVGLALLVPVLFWRKLLPRRLVITVIALAPLALYMIQINHRRAAYFCFILCLVAMLPLIWTAMTTRQARIKMIWIVTAVVLVGVMYVAAFWNSSSSFAKPAESVRSIFAPDERDYLSNLYRIQEDTNLHATISHSPIVGVGFGKPMDEVVQMVDLTDMWALQLYMPHNNILWLWMRMGILGFAIFWAMVGSVLILIAASVRLGIKRLAYLLSLEKKPERTGDSRARGLTADVPGLRVVHLMPSQDPSMLGHVRDRALADAHRAEVQECVEFLVLAFLALASLVSMLTLAQVDQGLMSPRLSSFWGLVLGTLTVAWEMNKAKFKLPIVQSTKASETAGQAASAGRYKEIEGAKRSRVRIIAGSENAA